jgi:hypothetical protein
LGFAGFGVFRGLLKSLRVFAVILMVRFFGQDGRIFQDGQD